MSTPGGANSQTRREDTLRIDTRFFKGRRERSGHAQDARALPAM